MLPKLPLDQWVNLVVEWVYGHWGPLLGSIAQAVKAVIDSMDHAALAIPWWVVIAVFAVLAYLAGKWKLLLGAVIGLLLIYDLGLWQEMIDTLVLVVISAFISIFIGIPLGICSARSHRLHRVLAPLLDLMQTMPPFVYLVPVLLLFNIGVVPAIFATLVFALPPAIRLTRIGILQVPEEMVEAARAYGSTDMQLLWKVQLPLALPTIKAGINQTLLLALSMVVIAAMIGAGGLGANVMSALETVDVGKGFEAGLSIVILAIILDRISQKIGRA